MTGIFRAPAESILKRSKVVSGGAVGTYVNGLEEKFSSTYFYNFTSMSLQ